ncbi:MAG: asparagine--tRNA ligase [Candidatus Sumerlaeia bacterium]|nr:asparagine--tRNA ligase [Candidatus Sumerlaeia bacterium]
MARTRIHELLHKTPVGADVTVRGWVRTRRDSKAGDAQRFSFVEVYDGSCFASIQVIADDGLANYEDTVRSLTTGCSVEVRGTLVESPAKGQRVEVRAASLALLGGVDAEKYPIQKKQTSFEYLREIAHLRARTNTFGAVARVRNRLAFAIHEFFQARGFYYIHTPIVTASDCEGAGEMFTVTKLDLKSPPLTQAKDVDFSQDFFGRHARLTVSGQLNVETYACALGDVYTFGPTFRAENSNTARHLAEFWMIEPELVFADLRDDMALAEEFLKHLFKTVLDDCGEDLAFFKQRIEPTVIETLTHVVEQPFEHMTYTEAVKTLLASGEKFEYPVEWGVNLQSEHERWLTEKHVRKPLIVTDYPRDIKAFYMRQNEDGRTVAAMDVLVPKIGEIIGGSQREERLDVLEGRIRELGMEPADYWWYLDLRRYGSVPHAGFGLGFERLIQFSTGMANIRDVIPFPRTPGNAEF